ncbi:MAG: ChrR family anti-sigma-E factor [Pseudomonadota bacterium]
MSLTHPSREYLAAYAAGTLSEGMTLLVASHLTYCASCRRTVAVFEAVSGAFLGAAEDASAPSLAATLAMLDEPEPLPAAREPLDPALPFPAPLRQAIEVSDPIRWRFRMPGVHEHQVSGYEAESVSVLRVRPGRTMPHHTHDADEATLILSGIMEDDGVQYRRGDVAIADQNHDHQPRVVGDETCYCLVVLAGGMRFTGPVSRALNIFSR